MMATATKTTTTDRIHAAVHQARTARHHNTCHCGLLRVNNAPYCTAQEATATRRVDILLDVLLQEHQP